MDHSPRISKLPKITKSSTMYVILKLLLNQNLLFIYNFQSFWSNLRLILLNPIWKRKFSCIQSSVPYNSIWQQLFDKILTNNPVFPKKKHGKHDDYAMIMVWIMTIMPRNMAAMPSSCHDQDHVSPWSWYDQVNIMAWQAYVNRNIENCEAKTS